MRKKTVTQNEIPSRAEDVPVTQKMLYLVRDELKSDIRATNSNLESLEHKMDARFDKMTSEIHRLAILVEEQNAKNNIVLDGLSSLFHRQDRVENQVTEFGKTLTSLKR